MFETKPEANFIRLHTTRTYKTSVALHYQKRVFFVHHFDSVYHSAFTARRMQTNKMKIILKMVETDEQTIIIIKRTRKL